MTEFSIYQINVDRDTANDQCVEKAMEPSTFRFPVPKPTRLVLTE